MQPRDLPLELVAVLGAARQLEAAARDRRQRINAITGTTRLLLACRDAGWRTFELAPVLGLKPNAAYARMLDGRRRGLDGTGINVPLAPKPVPKRTDIWRTPVDEREWLTVGEAAELAGVNRSTIARWRRVGLLPHTDWSRPAQPLYLRADVVRVMRWKRWRNGGVDVARLRDELAAQPSP